MTVIAKPINTATEAQRELNHLIAELEAASPDSLVQMLAKCCGDEFGLLVSDALLLTRRDPQARAIPGYEAPAPQDAREVVELLQRILEASPRALEYARAKGVIAMEAMSLPN